MTILSFRKFALLFVSAVAVAVLAYTSQRLQSGPEAPQTLAQFAGSTDLQIVAGSTAGLPVVSEDQTGTVFALVVSAAGSTIIEADITNGEGTIPLGPPHTIRAGEVTIAIPGADAFDVTVVPSEAGQQLDINVGPTAIRIDESTRAVGLLTDQWGNPVQNGTPIEMTIADSNGDTLTIDLSTTSGLVVADLFSVSFGDDFSIAMASEQAFTPAVDVHVQANAPLPFDLSLQLDDPLVADARSIITVLSDSLVDDQGHEILDGSNVVVSIDGPAGPSITTGEVVNGRVKADIVAPSRPGTLTLVATVNGSNSSPLTLDFTPAVVPFPVTFDVIDGERWLTIGPVIGPGGGLLPNGTEVVSGDRRLFLVDGRARQQLAAGEPIPTVSVLGINGVIS